MFRTMLSVIYNIIGTLGTYIIWFIIVIKISII